MVLPAHRLASSISTRSRSPVGKYAGGAFVVLEPERTLRPVIVTGLICVLIGLLIPSRILWIVGAVLILVGLVLLVLNLLGRGRRYY